MADVATPSAVAMATSDASAAPKQANGKRANAKPSSAGRQDNLSKGDKSDKHDKTDKIEKTDKTDKPERPDEEQFKADLAKAEKELAAAAERLVRATIR